MLIVLVMHSLLTLSSHAFRAGKPRVNRLMISRLLSNLEVKLGDVPLSASSSTSSTADIQSGSRDDYLFGNQSITFADLGVLPSLSAALTKLDKPFATTIQAATFDFILSGKDTVIAAETGSGKTLSYLIPILHLLLEDNYRENVHYPSAVIVVPNKELSFQVLRMANEILERVEPDQRTISIAAATSATGYWPYRVEESPNVLVCTPAFVGKFLRGPNILDEDLFRSIRHFVLDEADMLLEGSYLTDIEKILGTCGLLSLTYNLS